MKQFHVRCNKIFENGTVLAYDYNVDKAVKDGEDIVFHYSGVRGSYTMTIPSGEILARGKLSPVVYLSKHDGPNKQYKCYYFQWKEDKHEKED